MSTRARTSIRRKSRKRFCSERTFRRLAAIKQREKQRATEGTDAPVAAGASGAGPRPSTPTGQVGYGSAAPQAPTQPPAAPTAAPRDHQVNGSPGLRRKPPDGAR